MSEHAELPPIGRLLLLAAAGLAVITVLFFQLARMQLVETEPLGPQPDGRVLRIEQVVAPRGQILDRDGNTLARNVPELALVLIPGDIPPVRSVETGVLRAVERELGVSYAELEALLARGREAPDAFAPLRIRGGIDEMEAIRLRAALAGVPGVAVEMRPVRVYAGGELYGRVLGHVGPVPQEEVDAYLEDGYALDARVGLSGVELEHEETLRGRLGRRLVSATPAGRVLEVLAEQRPTPGVDLVLTIDPDLQRATIDALARAVGQALPEAQPGDPPTRPPPQPIGAAVVLDVNSGDLLALVSVPTVDAGIFSGGGIDGDAFAALLADERRPLVDRSFAEVNAPGSIFKPIVGLGALAEGVATPETRIVSTGSITVADQFNPEVSYVFGDWTIHGSLDFTRGLSRSSDVYYYYLAGGYAEEGRQLFDGLGVERVASYARAFGLGSPTGIDLPGEAAGLVPDPAWKREAVGEPWFLGDTYTLGIGQGYLAVTPLQMAVAAAAFANGGDVLVPRIVGATRSDAGVLPLPPVVASRVPAGSGDIEVVAEALRIAADPGGTAVDGEPEGMTIAGKTGTAEFGIARADGSHDTHAWYLGWAPYERPEIAIAVYLEHGIGSRHAAPVAREILEAYAASERRVRSSPADTP
ncbi:MAG: penicillin-binding protein 2 [Chloroflexi bacterium]|nr:penicillin-binding protein 2 [Chloroflexota bacterium]